MSKKIEDYLHLYIGCRVKLNDRVTEASRVVLSGIYRGIDRHGYSHNAPRCQLFTYPGFNIIWVEVDEFKLTLRRLSSITDEEVKDLFHFEKLISQYREVSFERQMWNNVLTGITVSYLTGDDEDGWHPQSWTMEFSGMNAQDFAWFLKHGFDLFQLIDEGLAIDAATIKTND